MNITNRASDWFGQAAGDEAEQDISVGGLAVRFAALQRDERLPELATLVGPDGDVVEIRTVRRQTTGTGHGLTEGGVDAAVGRHFGR